MESCLLISRWTTWGPLTRSVRDAAATLNILAGTDPRDESCSREPVPDYVPWAGRLHSWLESRPSGEFLL